MTDVIFAGDFFATEEDRPRSEFALLLLLEALVWIDTDYLDRKASEGFRIPSLYASGVTYERRRQWCQIPTMLRTGSADCKSLAAWRVAELRRRGIRARCELVGSQVQPDFWLYHVRVLWPAGPWGRSFLEDPSRVLGMGADEVA